MFSVDIPLNPLSPKSDQHEISPRDINVLENSGLENIIDVMIRDDESN